MDYLKHKEIDEKLADLFQHCHSKQYAAKSVIVRPGDSADTLYYIREGSVSITMENEEGEELIIAYLSQGDFLGEIGLLTKTGGRTVTVRARTACKTEEITYQKIKTLAPTELKICYPYLLELLAEQMANRLLATTRKAGDLAFLDVISRIVGCSREMAGRVLRILQDKGLVWARGKAMIIYDEEHRKPSII